MSRRSLHLFVLCLFAAPAAFAIDATCVPLVKATEARINQPAWHTISEVGGLKMEIIKADGKFFRLVGDKWTKFPVNIDDAERTFLAQIASGDIKLTNCKSRGSELVAGTAMNVFTIETVMGGAAPAQAVLYIGKLDGLPYQQTGKDMKAVYRYKGVVAPRL